VRFRRGVDISEASSGGFSPSRELTASSASSAVDQNVAAVPSHPGAKAQTEASEDQDLYMIPSPIVGTFYRAASPNAEAFVKIGSRVEPDTVVCIIEAMKLMNEIQAETTGEVARFTSRMGSRLNMVNRSTALKSSRLKSNVQSLKSFQDKKTLDFGL
jgi:acetyl-CoA carboxylase biotin carboxyl carrier protein